MAVVILAFIQFVFVTSADSLEMRRPMFSIEGEICYLSAGRYYRPSGAMKIQL